jgi:WD40 repeat protein
MNCKPLLTGLGALTLTVASLLAAPADKKSAPAKKVSYYKDVRPVFQANCQGCHQPAKSKGGYVMTDFKLLLGAGDSKEAAIVPKSPDKSHLVQLITPKDGKAEMPEGKKPLHATEIETIRNWIAQGAVDDTPANARERYDMNHPPVYSLPPVITSIDYSTDGQFLAVAGFHEVLLHKADGSGLAARLVGLSERIESVKFSPDGKRLAVAGGLPGRMGEVQVWDVEKRKLTLSHSVTYDTLYGASWSPDGKHIAFGCGDNTVRAIEADSGKQVMFMGSHSDWALDTTWSLKGDHVISVSRDMTAKLTELATQRFVDNITSITPNALKGGVATVTRHPLREEILMGGSDGLPKLYQYFRTANRQIGDDSNGIFFFDPMLGRVTSVAWSADGKLLAAASALDNKGEVFASTFTFGTNAITKEMADVMKKIPASRTPQDKTVIEKYKASGSKTLFKVAVPQAGVFAVAIAPDNKTVAAAGSDGLIRLFNAENGSILKEFPSVNVTAASKALAAKKFEAPAAPVAKTDGEPESLPKDAKIVALEVEPKSIALSRWTDSAQILVTARLANGEALDVTRLAKLELSGFSKSAASVSASGVVLPKANGSVTVKATLAGKSISVPVKVTGIGKDLDTDFIRDVNPVLTKAGCNGGVCHGAKDGKNGFKLSLRGYDAEYDVRAFTDELASRRANVASPDDSLMLLKPTAAVPHQGQMVFEPGSLNYRIIREWIGAGAKLNAKAPRVTKIELSPQNPVVQKVGARQQMRVIATYADGSTRDVTTLAFVDTGNQDVAKTDSANVVTTLRRGEAPMLARFEGAYAATTVTVMGDRSGFAWAEPEKWNKVDEFTAAKWQRMKILPSGLCTDDELIRRVYLDLTGVPPTADEVKAFLSDKRPVREKRDALVDRLVGSEDYVDHWSNKWADLLQVNSKFLGAEGAKAFRDWIRNEIAKNTPHDEFARKIITASGSNKDNPPASYYKILRKPEDTMENTTHLFLAVRFNCNKCHDHPFERWTQDQYYQTAAWFARVGLKKDPAGGDKLLGGTAVEGGKPMYEIIEELASGEVKHDRTGKETPPQFPYPATCDETGKPATEKKKLSRREELAMWITAKDNRYFASSFANRIWGYLTGVGVIEPLDDIRAGNPPSNPELLDYLTKEFVDSGFNTRHLMKLITKSRTYQLSVASHKWNEDDKINFSHATARRLPAEVLYDTIYKVTGAKSAIPGVPAGTRASQLADTGFKLPDGFFATMGKPPRESACECERTSDIQLGPIMALISGATVGDAVSAPDNAIAKLAKEVTDDRELINELFLRIMNRPARASEIEATLKSWSTMKADAATVNVSLAEYEKVFPGLQKKREETRAKDLADAKTELAAYEKEIAPREAKLDAEQKERTAKAEAELKRFNEQDFPKRMAEFEKKQDLKVQWQPVVTKNLKATGDLKLAQQEDKSIVVTEGKDVRSVYTITVEPTEKVITALRLEALTDKRFPKNGPGRAKDGNFVLNELAVTVTPKGMKPADAKKLELTKALADFSQQNFEVAKAIDGGNNRQQGWAVSPNGGATHWATFELKTPYTNQPGATLTFTLTQQFNGGNDSAFTLGRFRLATTTAKTPGLSQSEELRALLAKPASERTKDEAAALEKVVRATDAELAKRTKELADAKAPRPIDPLLKERQESVKRLGEPLSADPKLATLKRAADLGTKQLADTRLIGAQDLAWALINNPAFLFNR